MEKLKQSLDQPVVFLLVISLGVAGVFALARLALAKLDMTGPLGLFTMGTQ